MKTIGDLFLFTYFFLWYSANKLFYRLVLVLSDTHSSINPYINRRIRFFDTVIHAGDISTLDTLEKLQLEARVYAVCGNTETVGIEDSLPPEIFFELSGVNIYVTHELYDTRLFLQTGLVDKRFSTQPDVVIFGHTHKSFKKRVKNVLFLNPGSAGPKRSKNSSSSFGVLKIRKGKASAKIFKIPFAFYNQYV